MFRTPRLSAAALMLALSGPLSAAEDMRFERPGVFSNVRSAGMGAQLGVRVKLGKDRIVRRSDRVEIGIAAGPAFRRADGQMLTARVFSFTSSPGYDGRISLAGADVYRYQTRLGAAAEEKAPDQDQKPKKEQSAGDKAGWVALVAGGVMLALVAVFVATCPTCGS